MAVFDRAATARDHRIIRNKGILRTHERLARLHNKLKDDDRERRMQALNANDLEAYKELLQEQSGPMNKDDRNLI